MGDFDNVIFKFDIDELKYGGRIPHQLSISREVSFTFIKALRDVVHSSSHSSHLLSIQSSMSPK